MRITKVFILTAIVLFLIYYRIDILNGEAKDKNFEMQLGTYKIDITQINSIDYLKDSVLYKDLTITFNHDSSFYLNKNVPFIIEESGTWIPGGEGVEIWNTMFFGENRKYSTQFSRVWTKDSIFYINSVTPKENQQAIQKIYFKKIYR